VNCPAIHIKRRHEYQSNEQRIPRLPRRRGSACSTSSFVDYEDEENQIFLALARDAHEDEWDDGSSTSSHTDCELFSCYKFDEEDSLHLGRSNKMRRSNKKEKPRKTVTFGTVTIVEFHSKEAPVLSSPDKKKNKTMSVRRNEFCKTFRPPSPMKRHIRKHPRNENVVLRLSTRQISQLQTPSITSTKQVGVDHRPRSPTRRCTASQAA